MDDCTVNSYTSCIGCDCSDDCGIYLDSEEVNMSGITKDTFQGMEVTDKLNVLFDYVHDIAENAPKRVHDRDVKCARQVAECGTQFGNIWKAVKKNRMLNTAAASVGGSVGGATTVLVYLKWFA